MSVKIEHDLQNSLLGKSNDNIGKTVKFNFFTILEIIHKLKTTQGAFIQGKWLTFP
jgi:hypothetical protein